MNRKRASRLRTIIYGSCILFPATDNCHSWMSNFESSATFESLDRIISILILDFDTIFRISICIWTYIAKNDTKILYMVAHCVSAIRRPCHALHDYCRVVRRPNPSNTLLSSASTKICIPIFLSSNEAPKPCIPQLSSSTSRNQPLIPLFLSNKLSTKRCVPLLPSSNPL